MATYKINLAAPSWTQSVAALYYNTATPGKFYTDTAATVEITKLPIPTRECYGFYGFYSANSGGTQYIDENGAFTDALLLLSITSSKTFYVHQTKVSYKITLNDGEGSGGQGAIYIKTEQTTLRRFYYDDQCQTPYMLSVPVPIRTNYTFLGYFSTISGGTQYIKENGVATIAFLDDLEISDDKTFYAQWKGDEYILTFDPDGGTTPTQCKTVTFGEAVGTLPTPTNTRGTFVRWEYNGEELTASTVWNTAQNGTAYAKWNKYFGNVVDYFNLASDALVPIESDSGDNKRRICVANANWTGSGSSLRQSGGAGKYSSGVNETGGTWRNPTVTYVVAKDTTLEVTLGNAFAKTGTTISGYMITSVEVQTQIGQFPTVTISATANEGADAINKFSLSVDIVARSKAQNLMSAISGGGYLQELTLVAEAEPVVCEENLMPCASDIVAGRIEVQATTISPNLEAAPTAGSGFTSVGEPKKTAENSYSSYQITVQKELT